MVKIPAPVPSKGSLMIQSCASLISAGTERMLIDFSKSSLIAKAKSQPDKVKQVIDKVKTDGLIPTLGTVFKRLDQPMPLGYCNVGIIRELGELRNESFNIGDRVVSNGPHAEIVCVPANLAAKIPDNVSDEHAAFAVLGAIALQGVRLARPTLGEKFVVYGAGLIGLLTIQLLRASGCDVLAVDVNKQRLELAKTYTAKTCNSEFNDPVSVTNAWTEGIGVDGVIITASAKTNMIIHHAADMCRKRARIILVGVVGLNLRRSDFYEKELIFQVSCSYGPGRYDNAYENKGVDYPIGFVRWTEQRNLQAVLGAMANRQLDVTNMITNRFPFAEAEAAYDKISKDQNALGIILQYPDVVDIGRTITYATNISKPEGKCIAAMIGAGNFAKMTMGPALAKTNARLKYVSAHTNSAEAEYLAKKYSFENATTDLDQIWKDEDINTVFIATRHNTHARFVCDALEAGKHTFVEKPLCLTIEELEEIKSVQCLLPITDPPLLMVGFNRRFSQHIKKIKELISDRGEPVAMNFLCNAGIIPNNQWLQDPEVGGNRIIGEACHFIDLLSYICDSSIVSVTSFQMGKDVAVKNDKMSILLSFEDGSIGTVNYFGNGSKSYSKETLEVFSDGRILRLVNFRKLEGFGFKGFRKFKTQKIDKGHQNQFQSFVNCVNKGGEPLITFDEIVNVTLASFAAVDSAKTGKVISL